MSQEVTAKKSFLSRGRENPWIISTIVLGALFVITLFVASSGSLGSGAGEKEVSTKVVDFLNSQVQTGQVELQDITEENGLYKLSIKYQGDTIPVYATKNGKNIVYQLVPLDGTAPAGQQQQQQQGAGEPIQVETGNSPRLGSASAPVTIIEFSDFECPFCKKAADDAVKQVRDNYVNSGKVSIVYRDFPLSFHQEALPAARAARCYEEVKGGSDAEYFKYHDKLFENQASLSTENYKKWARDLGANGAQFDACFDSTKYTDEINAEIDYAGTIGVSGTPAFFIGNDKDGYVLLSGAQPFSAFKQIIDEQLAK